MPPRYPVWFLLESGRLWRTYRVSGEEMVEKAGDKSLAVNKGQVYDQYLLFQLRRFWVPLWKGRQKGMKSEIGEFIYILSH